MIHLIEQRGLEACWIPFNEVIRIRLLVSMTKANAREHR